MKAPGRVQMKKGGFAGGIDAKIGRLPAMGLGTSRYIIDIDRPIIINTSAALGKIGLEPIQSLVLGGRHYSVRTRSRQQNKTKLGAGQNNLGFSVKTDTVFCVVIRGPGP
jgi:hypothetical protein